MTDLPTAAQVAADGSSSMPEISKILIVYGPLGVLALLAIYVAIRLYRDREADRVKYELAMKEEREKYDALEERHITKSEGWMERYHELAQSMKQLLESVTKRR